MNSDDLTPEEWSLFERAEAAWERGDWGEALDFYLLLFQRILGRGAPLTDLVRHVLERVAGLATAFGLDSAADQCLQALVGSARSPAGADYVVLKQVHLALTRGRFRDARRLLALLEPRVGPLRGIPVEEADLPAWEARCWPDVGAAERTVLLTRLYFAAGLWLSGHGYYGQATALLRRGAVLARPPAPDLARRADIPLTLALAGATLEAGDLDEAGRLLVVLEPRIDPGREPGPFVERLELAGRLHLWRGDFGRALGHFAAVAEVCGRRGFHAAAVTALLNHARVLIHLNQLDAAEELLVRVTRSTDDPAALAQVALLARLARARSRPAGTLAVASSVYSVWCPEDVPPGEAPSPVTATADAPPSLPPPESFLALFEDRALELQWSLAGNDLPRALLVFDGMQAAFAASESLLIRVRLHLLAGMLALDRGDTAGAEHLLGAARPVLERLGLRPELWQTLRLLGACATREGRPAEREELSARADGLLTELAGSLSASQRLVYEWSKSQSEEEFLADEVGRLERLREALPAGDAERGRLAECLHQFLLRLDRNRREFGRALLGTAAPPAAACATLAERFAHQPADRATLSFLVLRERVFVCRQDRRGLHFVVCPVGRRRVGGLVARWLEDVRDTGGSAGATAAAEALARELRLEELLAGLPPEVRRLTLVPDDCLRNFPFSALRHRGRFLVEEYALTVGWDRSAVPAPPPAERGDALLIAVTRGSRPTPQYPEITPLSQTRVEVEALAGWLARRGIAAHPLIDDDADRETVLRRWAAAGFVHVACHGLFRPERPDASGLILVPAEGRPELLSLRDLARVPLPRLRHVTLSNCWSADSLVLPGRTTLGLPEVLGRAGARSVLACLWEVHDVVGTWFSERFYHHASERPRDEALRAAQRDCLARAAPEYRRPFYWAGYQLHGDGGRLVF